MGRRRIARSRHRSLCRAGPRAACRPLPARRTAPRRSRTRTGHREFPRAPPICEKREASRATAAANRLRARVNARTPRRSAAAACAPRARSLPGWSARAHHPAERGRPKSIDPRPRCRTTPCADGDVRRQRACAGRTARARHAGLQNCRNSPVPARPARQAPPRLAHAANRCPPPARRRRTRHVAGYARQLLAPADPAGRYLASWRATPRAAHCGGEAA